jgi:ATP-binding cassette, subfamily B, heavy metal transporter
VSSKVTFKENLNYYFFIAKNYKFLFALVLFLVLINNVVDVAFNLIYKVLVDEGTLFVANKITKDAFIEIIFLLALIYIFGILIHLVSKYFRVYFLNRLETKMMYDIKKDIFTHLLNLSHSFHTTHRTGSLISKLIRSGKSVEALTDFITFHGSPLVMKLIISFIVISYFNIYAGLVVFITATLFILYSLIILGKQQKVNIERNDADDFEKGYISDVFMNIETIKHFGKEKRITRIFSSTAKNTLKKYVQFWDYYAKMEAGFVIVLAMGTIGIMYFTLNGLIEGEITLGAFVFIYTSYLGLIMPLFEFMWGVRRTYEALSDMQAIVDYKNVKNEVTDKPYAKKLLVKKGSIEFKEVSFSYGRKALVKDFSLKIKPKEKVAFVGHSGAGKTTIVKLLYRLYDVDSGSIKIDGDKISEFTQESLRNEMSIVPQECILFNDTIYNNVLFSNPSASRKDAFKALKAAQLYSFVMSLPEKENTIVGERGIKLSGGEKQRLSIARAILANKKILVLDEATSSLDSTTEYQIQKALKKLMQGKTTIMIAHRLSTIMHVDKIVVIEGGKIVDVGSHDELNSKKGIYRKLWKLQKEGEIE